MVSKEKDFSSGVNTTFSDDLNATILQPVFTNNSAVSQSESTNTSGSFTEKRSVSIDAGTVQDEIVIKFDLNNRITSFSRGSANLLGANSTGTADLKIDGSSEIQVSRSSFAEETSGDVEYTKQDGARFVEYKYKPTSTEKQNGFTVSLELKTSLSFDTDGSADAQTESTFFSIYAA